MDKPFTVIQLEPNEKVPVTREAVELRPVQMFILPEGTKENKTSFTVALAGINGGIVAYGQISLKMLLSNIPVNSLPKLIDEAKEIIYGSTHG